MHQLQCLEWEVNSLKKQWSPNIPYIQNVKFYIIYVLIEGIFDAVEV